MIRELIKADFGIDLPIRGDTTSDRNDPMVIETEVPEHASRVQMDFARCVYRRLDTHWRTLAKEKVIIAGRPIEKLTHELKFAEGNQVTTSTVAQYFDVSMAVPEPDRITPPCFIDLGNLVPFSVPYQLGWMNYSSILNNELSAPGLGLTIQYGAPHLNLSLYIYNKGSERIDCNETPELFRAEFEAAVSDIVLTHPQAEPGIFRDQDGLLFKAFSIDSAYSCLMLMTARNHFIKVRATQSGTDDGYVFDCLMESLNVIASMIKLENAPSLAVQ